MKVLSLFDGISCARVALQRAGIKVEAYYSSEIDKYAIQIAQKNFPDTIQLGDIKEIETLHNSILVDIEHSDIIAKGSHWGISFIDLLIGGSPCQDLSVAKKNREGLKGSRSGLFYEYVRILNEIKPKYFILENVNSMPKEAKQTITETLFGIEPIMINAALVSAQNRKRLFWVGKRVGDTYEQVKIQLPEDKGILLKDILETGVSVEKLYCLPATYYKENVKSLLQRNKKGLVVLNKNGEEQLKSNTVRLGRRGGTIGDKHNWDTIRIGQIGKGGQADRIYSPEGKSTTLSANGGGGGAKTGLYAVAQRGRNIVNGKRKDILGAKTEQRIEIGDSDKAHTITSVFKDSMIMKDSVIRKLTPIECERLQCLPDNYTEGISNTQRYKCLGNAFNCDVVAHILTNLNN